MRLLQAEEAAPPPEAMAVDSDVMVILAALLCALICVVGLALVARCAWLRRSLSGGSAPTQPPPNKGLKKKVLRSLPKLSFAQATAAEKFSAECPICLAEFADGDEIRILPQCGHAFHVVCVDTWLGSHSSCPSCRQGFAAAASAAKCERCGGSPAVEVGANAREDRDANTFLP